ncbi:MAG: hypothetical protein JG764_151 [Clostridiales bacterium]|jgi:predicted DNA-binding protein with PD1-like motif|nr:hypothetical protein [Clostridiales bacterium]
MLYSIVSENEVKKTVILKVNENSDLLRTIENYALENDIKGAVILGGVGALKQVTYRNARCFPVKLPFQEEELLVETIEKPLEILNLSGWIAEDENNKPAVHCHISCSYVSDRGVKTIGGHLMPESTAWLMVAVSLQILHKPLKVEKDINTNWYDLKCF